ncbi:MAG: FAD-dependent oxidoreductase [Bilifractor sp.]|jgi:hypothetical protein
MKSFKQTVIYPSDCEFPVLDSVDVLVCGGGPAGVAAAITAASRGQKTLLVERLGFLGGMAVAGYSGTICGLFYNSENPIEEGPQQIVFGMADRFYQELIRRKGVTEPQLYGKTFLVPFDPQVWKEAAEDMVLHSGASILYHTEIFGVLKDGDEFKGVLVNTKEGLSKILAKVIIDATGDGDVCYRGGLAYTMGDHGQVQNPTMIFRLGNVNVPEFKKYWGEDTISPDYVSQRIKDANESGKYHLPRLKVWVYPTNRPGELFMNVTMINGMNGRMLNAMNPVDHTEAEIVARKQVREYARFFRDQIPGCEESFVNDLSCEVGIRQSRSIVGIDRLRDDDVANARKREDGIARCPWPIELHNGEKPYMFWLIHDYYEIPYGALVPERGENLIVAGRNLCAEHRALASCRVTAQCFGYGEAAGVAADLAVRTQRKFREIPGREIREALNQSGARLDEKI